MSDGFKIDGPGFYRQRDGGKAEVAGQLNDGAWCGLLANAALATWLPSGKWTRTREDPRDLIAPLSDPPALEWTWAVNNESVDGDSWTHGGHEIYLNVDGLFIYKEQSYPTLAAAKRAAEQLEAERVAKETPKEPIPSGVWWDEQCNRFGGVPVPRHYWTCSTGFYRKWYARRAEFPQSPPTPPATGIVWQNIGIGNWKSGDFTIQINPDGCFQSRFLAAPFNFLTKTLEEAKIFCKSKMDELKAKTEPPTPPATPWTQADVPWPILFLKEGCTIPLSEWSFEGNKTGIRWREVFQGSHTYSSTKWEDLARHWQWSPNNVDWMPCTREAVAAWRNGGAK